MISNSAGNTNRDVRKFLRENGMKPSAENVERISREVRRTEAQNEFRDKIGKEIAKERGESGTYDQRGDAHKQAREAVLRRIEKDRGPKRTVE